MTRYQLQVKFPGEDWENTVYKPTTDKFAADHLCDRYQREWKLYNYRVVEVTD